MITVKLMDEIEPGERGPEGITAFPNPPSIYFYSFLGVLFRVWEGLGGSHATCRAILLLSLFFSFLRLWVWVCVGGGWG